MRYSISDTAEYGDLTRGPRVVTRSHEDRDEEDPQGDPVRQVRQGMGRRERERSREHEGSPAGRQGAPDRSRRRPTARDDAVPRRRQAEGRPTSAAADPARRRVDYVGALDGLRAFAVARRSGVSRRTGAGRRWVPGRVGVLHAVGVPHHHVAAARASGRASDRPRPLLRTACPPAGAGRVRIHRSGAGPRFVLDRRPAPCAARRRRRQRGERRQLALRVRRSVVPGPVRRHAESAGPLLVARHRGAVLPAAAPRRVVGAVGRVGCGGWESPSACSWSHLSPPPCSPPTSISSTTAPTPEQPSC